MKAVAPLRLSPVALLIVAAALALPGVLQAQAVPAWESQLFDTRERLQDRLAQYEAANSDAYDVRYRALVGSDADLIRNRLVEGDFQVGDKITLRVMNQAQIQQEMSGDFVVSQDRELIIPIIGAVPLRGVLRSELHDHLMAKLKVFILNPTITALTTTVRITVTGPGVPASSFQDAPADSRLIDVLTAAGLTAGAQIDRVTVERNGREIWGDDALHEAMVVQGRTLDQLSLRAGDQVIVPAKTGGGFDAMTVLRSLPYLITLGFAISRIL